MRADLTNALTTIHRHGIALRNDLDGMPDLTQPAVAPGGTFATSSLPRRGHLLLPSARRPSGHAWSGCLQLHHREQTM
ncbi:multicopper oxidase domain-containing protein [Nocardia sp. CA-151230]|uniref:multicopper oxidase domain-containing protein n=1 Tax=Nocardia sp. CA-151230 TaxID=3239982 RepID=UPI003D8D4D49